MRVDLDVPKSALAIGAHPDDIEFECGATLAKWAEAGTIVHLLVCTDGRKGTWDIDADTDALVARRQVEQREAARRLGATGEVRFLDQVDGELDMGPDSGLELRGEVARIIRELTPTVVLTHDPWRRWRMHPDHRNAGWVGVDAVVAARDPHYFREHDIPITDLSPCFCSSRRNPTMWRKSVAPTSTPKSKRCSPTSHSSRPRWKSTSTPTTAANARPSPPAPTVKPATTVGWPASVSAKRFA